MTYQSFASLNCVALMHIAGFAGAASSPEGFWLQA